MYLNKHAPGPALTQALNLREILSIIFKPTKFTSLQQIAEEKQLNHFNVAVNKYHRITSFLDSMFCFMNISYFFIILKRH